ncbi:MAG: hypothetical protein KGO82_18900 [Bacteroidota bacterium]|nr:hypothetical protein [Bacteroidota bacterium]
METLPGDAEMASGLKWKKAWSGKRFRWLFLTGWFAVIGLLMVFHQFLMHIEKREGVLLNDWLLQQLPVYNVSLPVFLFIWGATLLALYRSVGSPKICILLLWTYFFVTMARLISIWLIPLNPPPDLIPLADPLTNLFYGKQFITRDLFFSGHTSSVFIIFLCLPRRADKIFSLVSVICIAALLLVQHVHYSIDIIAAPIMSYGCFLLARRFTGGR